MILATHAGDNSMVWLLIACVLLLNRKTRYVGIMTLIVLALATLIGEELLKNIFQRSRPYDEFPLVDMVIGRYRSSSFPSGHTASSFAAAYILSRYLKRFSLVFWSLAVLISFSRMYLFLHYPSDVLGGVVLGLFCGVLTEYFYETKFKDKLKSL
jgi:undecaprenyl-diphosphatase